MSFILFLFITLKSRRAIPSRSGCTPRTVQRNPSSFRPKRVRHHEAVTRSSRFACRSSPALTPSGRRLSGPRTRPSSASARRHTGSRTTRSGPPCWPSEPGSSSTSSRRRTTTSCSGSGRRRSIRTGAPSVSAASIPMAASRTSSAKRRSRRTRSTTPRSLRTAGLRRQCAWSPTTTATDWRRSSRSTAARRSSRSASPSSSATPS